MEGGEVKEANAEEELEAGGEEVMSCFLFSIVSTREREKSQSFETLI